MATHPTDDTIIFKVYNDIAAANFAQTKLKEAGIDSFLQDENVVGLNPLGGIELKIFAHDLSAAKKVMEDQPAQ